MNRYVKCEMKTDDKSSSCYKYKGKPHIHLDRSGFCDPDAANHNLCRGVGSSMGGRKIHNCPCDCHDEKKPRRRKKRAVQPQPVARRRKKKV